MNSVKDRLVRFLSIIAMLGFASTAAWGQSSPPQALASTPRAPAPAPSTPTAVQPSAAAPAAAASAEARLERRLQELEARYEMMERKHAERYEALLKELKAVREQSGDAPTSKPARTAGSGVKVITSSSAASASVQPAADRSAAGRTGASAAAANRTGGMRARGGDPDASERSRQGLGAQGTEGRTFIREYDVKPVREPGRVTFSDGLVFSSEDSEFQLTFHNLTQVDYRAFPTADHGLLQDQFVIPRQRWYFTGQVTRNFEFYTTINRGLGTLDLLDAFMTINVSEILSNPTSGTGPTSDSGDPFGAQGEGGRASPDRGTGSDSRVRLRIGRMKTPYLYEWYSIAAGDLIAPERSLYANNFGTNRQIGAMLLGELFERRVGYASGVFNGPRRSFTDSTNSNVDLFFYGNTRPFLATERFKLLQYLNIGGSTNFGVENGSTQPAIFTTAAGQSGNSSIPIEQSVSPTFLVFNNNVKEDGLREQWAAHIAYFYKSFMLLTEYGGGFAGYTTNGTTATRVPFDGYMVQASYFLTGEQKTRRVNVVRPTHRLGFDNGRFYLGAIEVHSRYSVLDISPRVFSAGLADPNIWADRAQAVDIGFNWYWNYYTKFQFDWQHAVFNNPVTTGAPGHFMSDSDIFWLRFQLFF